MAYDSELSVRDKKAVREHLSFILPKLKEPNSLIDPVKQALSVMNSRKAWYETPLGIIVISVVGAIIAGGIIFKLGWN